MIDAKKRKELLKKLDTVQDKQIIDEIYRLLDMDVEDDLFVLSKEQKEEIEFAQKQIAKGEGRSSETMNDEIDQWLKKLFSITRISGSQQRSHTCA